MERGALDAGTFLPHIIFQKPDGTGMEADDGVEVTERDATHEEIAQAPYQVEARQGSEHHHHDAVHHPHEEQPATVLREELHIHLAIGVVADDRREGKHEDGQGDKGGTDLPHLTEQRVLRELDAVEVMVRINPTEEDDESRAAADKQRVGEDTQRLYQPLLHGMAHIGDTRCTGCRPFARLIGEQAALDARHHHRAEGAAGKLLKAESVLQDDAEDGRQQPDVHDDDDDRQQHIEHRHHRYEDATDLGNAIDAAKDTEGREDD